MCLWPGRNLYANNDGVSIRVRVLTPVHLRGRFVATFVVKTAALVRTMNLANLGNVSVYPHAQMMGRGMDNLCGGTCGCGDGLLCAVEGVCYDPTACNDTCQSEGKECGSVCGLIVGVVALERLVPPEPAFKSLQT